MSEVNPTQNKVTPVRYEIKCENDSVVTYGTLAIKAGSSVTPDDVKKIFQDFQAEQPEGVKVVMGKVLPEITKNSKECKKQGLQLVDSAEKVREVLKNTANSITQTKLK